MTSSKTLLFFNLKVQMQHSYSKVDCKKKNIANSKKVSCKLHKKKTLCRLHDGLFLLFILLRFFFGNINGWVSDCACRKKFAWVNFWRFSCSCSPHPLWHLLLMLHYLLHKAYTLCSHGKQCYNYNKLFYSLYGNSITWLEQFLGKSFLTAKTKL